MDDVQATEQVDVAIIGGGLAGLAAATTAAASGQRVLLLDGHPLGGRARTESRAGFVFNRGPRALYLGGEGKTILDRFGVPTPGGPPSAREAMGLRGGKVQLLPQNVSTMVRTKLFRPAAKVRLAALLARMARIDPTEFAGITLNEWLAGTGLPPEAADLVRMLTRVATYVNAPDRISADIALRQMQLALGRGVRYVDGGWQSLVDGLAAKATSAGAQLRTHVNVRGIEDRRATDPGVRILVDGGDIVAGAVILAAGTPSACAAVLGNRPAPWTHVGPEVGAACLELGLRRPPPIPVIFGIDQPVYFSTHSPPAHLAPEGGAVVHVLRYQPPEGTTTTTEDRAELRDLARLAGVTDDDIVEEVFLRRMVVTGGFPTPAHGGLAGRPPVAVDGHDRVFVAGDWVGPTGFLGDAALSSGVTAGDRASACARSAMSHA